MKQKRVFLAHLAMVFVPKALTEYFNQTGATISNCSEVFILGRERFESVALCTLGARQAPSPYVVAQRQFLLQLTVTVIPDKNFKLNNPPMPPTPPP